MTTANSTETAAKKGVLKLQRAIVDGLEDVKAQDIQVFNTEHLSPLFERVIVASGTSNRQTKALASSVREAVREAGFAKPRIEGEDNGEWIIVDCGSVVAHIMQPAIRQYYHLEDIWGDTPVRLKLGTPKPAGKDDGAIPAKKTAAKQAAVSTAPPVKAPARKAPASPSAPADAQANGKPRPAPRRAAPGKVASARRSASAAAGTTATSSQPRASAVKVAAKTLVVGKPVAKKALETKSAVATKPAARKPAAKKAMAKPAAARRS